MCISSSYLFIRSLCPNIDQETLQAGHRGSLSWITHMKKPMALLCKQLYGKDYGARNWGLPIAMWVNHLGSRFCSLRQVLVDWTGATILWYGNSSQHCTVWIYHIYLFIYQLMDSWGSFNFWLLWIKLFWTFLYRFFFVNMFFSFLFGKYLWEELLDHRISICYLCKTNKKTTRSFPKVGILFYIPINTLWKPRHSDYLNNI